MTSDAAFTGSIPAIYDRCLGPLLFEPYAADIAARAAAFKPRSILETAAGTGIVTKALSRAIPDSEVVATDLNQAMLDVAATKISSDLVRFRQADAQNLPFEAARFDAIICQFGFMFFPDRPQAYREARRVLKPGGKLLFNVWDELGQNRVSAIVAAVAAEHFPNDPPSFLERVPFGYGDTGLISRQLEDAGFKDIGIATVRLQSRSSAEAAAEGLTLGTPLRSEIEARDPGCLDDIREAAAEALARSLGNPFSEQMSAHVIVASA